MVEFMSEIRKKRFKSVEKLRSFFRIFSKDYGKTSIEPRGKRVEFYHHSQTLEHTNFEILFLNSAALY